MTWFTRHLSSDEPRTPAPSTLEDANNALARSTEEFVSAVKHAEVTLDAARRVKHQRQMNNIGPGLAAAIGRLR